MFVFWHTGWRIYERITVHVCSGEYRICVCVCVRVCVRVCNYGFHAASSSLVIKDLAQPATARHTRITLPPPRAPPAQSAHLLWIPPEVKHQPWTTPMTQQGTPGQQSISQGSEYDPPLASSTVGSTVGTQQDTCRRWGSVLQPSQLHTTTTATQPPHEARADFAYGQPQTRLGQH